MPGSVKDVLKKDHVGGKMGKPVKCADCGTEFEPKWELSLFCSDCLRRREEGAEQNRQRLLKYFENKK